jgi:hypothetical protein
MGARVPCTSAKLSSRLFSAYGVYMVWQIRRSAGDEGRIVEAKLYHVKIFT